MQDPIMFKAKGNGIDMQLAQWGSDAHKTILCVHGMTANSRCWDRLVPALSGHHRVLGGEEDLLLPRDAVTDMLKAIPNSRDMAVEGTNHFSILFDQHPARDKALASFLR